MLNVSEVKAIFNSAGKNYPENSNIAPRLFRCTSVFVIFGFRLYCLLWKVTDEGIFANLNF